MELSLRHDRVGTTYLTLEKKEPCICHHLFAESVQTSYKHILLISTVVMTLILQRCNPKEVRAYSLKTHPGKEQQSWAPGQSARRKVLSC